MPLLQGQGLASRALLVESECVSPAAELRESRRKAEELLRPGPRTPGQARRVTSASDAEPRTQWLEPHYV